MLVKMLQHYSPVYSVKTAQAACVIDLNAVVTRDGKMWCAFTIVNFVSHAGCSG